METSSLGDIGPSGILIRVWAGGDLENPGNWLHGNSQPERGDVDAGGLTPLHSRTLSPPPSHKGQRPQILTHAFKPLDTSKKED